MTGRTGLISGNTIPACRISDFGPLIATPKCPGSLCYRHIGYLRRRCLSKKTASVLGFGSLLSPPGPEYDLDLEARRIRHRSRRESEAMRKVSCMFHRRPLVTLRPDFERRLPV